MFSCAYSEFVSWNLRTAASDYSFTLVIFLKKSYFMKKNYELWPFMVKKMFIEIRLCSSMTYDFKGHVKIDEIYMVKFNVSISNSLEIMGFFVNSKYIHKSNVISNKTVTKLFTILTKCFSSYLNPTSYLKR